MTGFFSKVPYVSVDEYNKIKTNKKQISEAEAETKAVVESRKQNELYLAKRKEVGSGATISRSSLGG